MRLSLCLVNVGRAVPIGRRDTLPVRVQSPAWRNGQEGSGNDRLAVPWSKQFRIGGAAALERHADSEATDASATLALAATPLRDRRVSHVGLSYHGIYSRRQPAWRGTISSAWLAASSRREDGRAFPGKDRAAGSPRVEESRLFLISTERDYRVVLPGRATQVNIPTDLSQVGATRRISENRSSRTGRLSKFSYVG